MHQLKKSQIRILSLMEEAVVGAEKWVRISSPPGCLYAIRRTWTCQTPDSERERKLGWDEETYHCHVFLYLTRTGVLLRYSPAPWVESRQGRITYAFAAEVICDPEKGKR